MAAAAVEQQDANDSTAKDKAKIKVAFSGLELKLYFAFKRTTKLKKIMELFASNTDVPLSRMLFKFEGRSLRGNDTPALIGLSDSDVIEVFEQTDGGASVTY